MLSQQNPDIAANPGAVQQGQMLRFLSRCAASVTGHAENGADIDPSTQRPAAGTHNVAVPHEVLFPAIGGALRVLFTPAKSAQQTFEVAA